MTVGHGSVVAWLPMAMSTVLAPSTLAPGSGLELTTLPTWSASPSVWRGGADHEARRLEHVGGVGHAEPEHGHVDQGRPGPDREVTVVRLATWVPAAGLVVTTLPISSTSDSPAATLPTRSPAAMIWLDASDWLADHAGTATCDGVAGR